MKSKPPFLPNIPPDARYITIGWRRVDSDTSVVPLAAFNLGDLATEGARQFLRTRIQQLITDYDCDFCEERQDLPDELEVL